MGSGNITVFCCYCGEVIEYGSKEYTKEHVVPKSRGGNNLAINKFPCCSKCNNMRGNMSLDDFYWLAYDRLQRAKRARREKAIYRYGAMVENISHVAGYVEKKGDSLYKHSLIPKIEKQDFKILGVIDLNKIPSGHKKKVTRRKTALQKLLYIGSPEWQESELKIFKGIMQIYTNRHLNNTINKKDKQNNGKSK